MSAFLDNLLADAHEEMFNGVAIGAAVGTAAAFLTQKERTNAGIITAAAVGCVAIASVINADDDDLLRYKVAGGNTVTAAIGTAVVTFGVAALADFIWGDDA